MAAQLREAPTLTRVPQKQYLWQRVARQLGKHLG